MTRIWKCLGMALAVALVFALAVCHADPAETELTLDVPVTVTLTEPEEMAYFSFVPEETGYYQFYSISESNTYGYLYDEYGSSIRSDDDSGVGQNFKIFYKLTAGVRYRYGARFSYYDGSGSFQVAIARATFWAERAVQQVHYVPLNGDVTLSMNAYCASGEPQFEWQGLVYDDNGESHYEVIEGETGSAYTLQNVTRPTSIYCYVSESDDGCREGFQFIIYIDNQFSVSAQDTYRKVEPGDSTEMEVVATCGTGSLHYEWNRQVRDENGNEDYVKIEGAENSSYTALNIQEACYFYCNVSDDYDNHTTMWFHVEIDNGFSADAYESTIYVPRGDNCSLYVNTTCNAGTLHYAWFHQVKDENGYSHEESIEGAEGPSYIVENVQHCEVYSCRVNDDYYNSCDVSFVVILDNGFNVSAAESTVYTRMNEDATLTVNASCNEGTLHYQWYQSVANPDNSGSHQVRLDGETGSTYIRRNVTAKEEYNCRVTDDYGNSADIPIRILIDNGFQAELVESDFYVLPNTDVTLEVEASCDSGLLSYQWYKEGEYGYAAIEGATGPTLEINNVTQSGLYYYCYVADEYDNSSCLYASICLDNAFEAKADQNWFYVKNGTNLTLEVNASCRVGNLHYQWYYERQVSPDSSVEEEMPDETGPTLTVENITEPRFYDCEVKDDYGNSSSLRFEIRFDNAFRARAEENYLLVPLGGQATARVIASCDKGPLTYVWKRVNQGSGGYSETVLEGETGQSLTLTNITKAATYHCSVKDDYGNDSIISFNVGVENGFTVDYNSSTITLLPGEGTTLVVTASCDTGELTYEWYDQYSDPIDGVTGNTYSIDSLDRSWRDYRCCVTDQYGNQETANFYLYLDNGFYAVAEEEEVTVAYGEPAMLKVRAYCDEGELTYTWEDNNGREIEGANGPELMIEEVTSGGCYSCTVRDIYGSYCSIDFDLFVENGFTVEPSNSRIIVLPNEEVTLTVTANSLNGELTYRWFDDYEYEWIDGADTNTLTVKQTRRTNEYICEVTDRYGNKRRADFIVSLNNQLEIHAITPQFVHVSSGDTVTLKVSGSALEGDLKYYWGGTYLDELQTNPQTEYTTDPITKSQYIYCYVNDKYYDEEEVEFYIIVDEEATTLTPGQELEVSVGSEERRTFVFTPTETATYTFESFGQADSCVDLYDGNAVLLGRSDDQGSDNVNFRLSRELTAGTTYYYIVRKYGKVPSFTVLLSKETGPIQEDTESAVMTLRPGQRVWLEASITAFDDDFNFSSATSDNPSVVEVSGRQISAGTTGTAHLTVVYTEGDDSNTINYIVTVADGSVLNLPAGLRQIENDAFAGDTSVRYVVLGENVRRVEKDAFKGTAVLQIVVTSRDTFLSAGALRNVENVTIVCPSNSYAASYASRNDYTCVLTD